jgi:hypothetical protein
MILALIFVSSACQSENQEKELEEEVEVILDNQETISGIEGKYTGHGECVITDSTGAKLVIEFTEHDAIEKYPGAKNELYKVSITGDGFSETELGALSGNVLRTATSVVSDGNFPVLEEYIFETDASGNVTGFTKIVRNPTDDQFKTCIVNGKKIVE